AARRSGWNRLRGSWGIGLLADWSYRCRGLGASDEGLRRGAVLTARKIHRPACRAWAEYRVRVLRVCLGTGAAPGAFGAGFRHGILEGMRTAAGASRDAPERGAPQGAEGIGVAPRARPGQALGVGQEPPMHLAPPASRLC